MKYSILIIAIECHYSHVSRFVRNLKQENPDAVIHLLTNYEDSSIPGDILTNVDKVYHCSLSLGLRAFDTILKSFRIQKAIKGLSNNSRYDIINIHFPHYYMAGTFHLLRRMSKTIVVSPWGSDILRVEGIRRRLLFKGVLEKCDIITTSLDGNIGRKILDILPHSRTKFYPQAWGSETIDYLCAHGADNDTITAKRHFGIAEHLYVITCGYNAFRAQNHLKIIDSIAEIRQELPKNFLLLFPVSYGGDDKQYIEVLKKTCQEKHLEALFIEDYLSVPEVCMLRMATDMFVHVQDTDAGCASLQEYILCGKKIVHGGWVRYPMLEDFPPLCYHVAPNFFSLGKTILEALNSEPIAFSQELLQYIKSNGWKELRKGWNEMFEMIAESSRKNEDSFVS